MSTKPNEIKPGNGYWDATNYPIGGKFCRVSRESGLAVTVVAPASLVRGYGWLVECTTQDKRRLFVPESSLANQVE